MEKGFKQAGDKVGLAMVMDNSTSRGTDLIGTGLEARSPGKRPCSVAQAALTKYRRRCGLNNRNVFSHNCEGYKS